MTSILPPAALATRLDTILMAAERLLRSLPDCRLDGVSPDQDQSLRELGFRIFRLGLAFIDAVDAGRLPESWLREKVPDDMRHSRTLANYGALVRGRLAGWFEGTGAGAYARIIDAHDGPRSGHELLERTTEQAAQHLRQLHALAERER